jgi:hypothetical protein
MAPSAHCCVVRPIVARKSFVNKSHPYVCIDKAELSADSSELKDDLSWI